MTTRRKVLLLAALVLAVTSMPLARRALEPGTTESVEVEPLSRHPIRSSTLASGVASHENEAHIGSEVIGRVEEVLVREGDSVEKGQLLLRIADARYLAEEQQYLASVRIQELEVSRARLRIKNLTRLRERNQRLLREGVLNQLDFEAVDDELQLAQVDHDASRAALNQSLASLAQSRDVLAKTRVLSPLSGIVTSVDIKAGEMAIPSTTNLPGSTLLTIADPDSIRTIVNVDEADIAKISVGQRVEVHAAAYPDVPMSGVVEAVATTAKVPTGKQGRSFEVNIRLTDTRGVDLKPGMSCRAEIFSAARDALLAVPVRAIQETAGIGPDDTRYYVFIKDGSTARKVAVRTGVSDDDYQHIEGEVKEGDLVVVGPDRALRSLADGDRVDVIDPCEMHACR